MALGGKCVICGIDDIRVLQIDHINNDGQNDRSSRRREFHREIVEGKRSDLQILCANHHSIKNWEVYESNRMKRIDEVRKAKSVGHLI